MTHNGSLRQIIMVVVFTIAVSLVLSTPGVAVSVGVGTTPTDLGGQPVGQAQSGADASQQNASNTNATEPAVEFSNQTTNGSTITIERITLPANGFVAIHTEGYAMGVAPTASSIIAVSDHLSAGTHRNVTIDISHAPPGNPPGLNRTQLNTTQTLVAVAYRDTDNDHQFGFVRSFGENDSVLTENGSVVRDSARVRVPTPEPTTASVVFRNQTLQNNTLVVAKARLPRGGFIVAYNVSLQRTGDPLTSAVGISRYLSPGNYTDIPLRVLPGALDETQVVTVRPALDTNDNQQYDYIRTSGFQDVAYETVNHSAVIEDSALVRVPLSQQATPTLTPTPTRTTTTTSPSTAASRGAGESGGSGGLLGGLGIGVILAIPAVAIGLVLVARRLR